jgi:SAM-dependent methyltransferase
MDPAPQQLDTADLEARVQSMYELVANFPQQEFHFETGRDLAERLGYPADQLDRIPPESIESFAGVGYFHDLAALRPGETVLDLGSGSGMDSFLAALAVGPDGRVVGIDMTPAQIAKSRRLGAGWDGVEFREGRIEAPGTEPGAVDCIISNGVINLVPDKQRVFEAAAAALRPGGRLAVADIVSGVQLPGNITCDASLWAACIGGAMQQDGFTAAIEAAGLRVEAVRPNDAYRFLSARAVKATSKYGVVSVSVLAVKAWPGFRLRSTSVGVSPLRRRMTA